MLELRIMQGQQAVPIFNLPTFLGRHDAAREIGNTIDGLIAFLDDLGGDPDLETTGAEDDFMDHPLVAGVFEHGPGCPVADPDVAAEQDGERGSYAEWHTLSAARRRAGHIDGDTVSGSIVDEDAELDGDESDGNFADDEPAAHFKTIRSGPGCIYSDPDKGGEEDGEREDGQ